MTSWRFAAATDTGLVRETNQDAVMVDEAIAIVADGMGGHAAGEVAAAMTVALLHDRYQSSPTMEGVVSAFGAANAEVLADAATSSERRGMGTTALAVALIKDPSGHMAPALFHVGDSRAYQIRDGALKPLTQDHSVAEEWVRLGRLTPQEALTDPTRHQLTRAIGVDQPLEVDVATLAVQPGDRLVLCSDGLSNELSEAAIAELASVDRPLEEVVANLIAAAKAAGGRDNITAVVLEFLSVASATHPFAGVRTPPPPTPPAAAPQQESLAHSAGHRRLVTWRTGLATLVLAGVAWGAYAIVHWYAYATFYISVDGGYAAIYQGQPSGVLWFTPHERIRTNLPIAHFRPADQVALRATISEPSLAAATYYVHFLHSQWRLTQPSTTTTVVTRNG